MHETNRQNPTRWGILGDHGGGGGLFFLNTPLKMHLSCVSCGVWTNEYILMIFLFTNIL